MGFKITNSFNWFNDYHQYGVYLHLKPVFMVKAMNTGRVHYDFDAAFNLRNF